MAEWKDVEKEAVHWHEMMKRIAWTALVGVIFMVLGDVSGAISFFIVGGLLFAWAIVDAVIWDLWYLKGKEHRKGANNG